MLIKKTKWYKLYKHNLDIDSLLFRVRNHMTQTTPRSISGFDSGQKAWTFECKQTYDYVNSIHPIKVLYSEDEINKFAIWEMNKGSTLAPHVDANHNTGFVVLPLIGTTKTSMHGPVPLGIDNNSKTPVFDEDLPILESVTYGVGEMIVVNNTQFIHSVKPVDDYRLTLQFNAKEF